MKLKKIITEEMLRNMELLAVTNPGMMDALEQAKVIYVLNGSPKYFDDENSDTIDEADDVLCWNDEDDDEELWK